MCFLSNALNYWLVIDSAQYASYRLTYRSVGYGRFHQDWGFLDDMTRGFWIVTGKPPLNPGHINMLCDIIVDIPSSLDYRPQILESISLEDILYVKSHFHTYLKHQLLNLLSKYSVIVLLNLNPLVSKVCLHVHL